MKASWDGFTYSLDDPSFEWYINNGRAEPYTRELDVVKRYLDQYPSNNTCIDVGAHIGTTSFPYSRIFSRVVAFEPNTKSYNFFCENIQLNNCKNIQLFNKGVYNKAAHCKVVKHGENSGCYYIKECEKDESSIEVVRLDDLEIEGPIDFIKIDTEGSELYVLEGGSETISKYKPLIQVETNHCSDTYFGYNKENIYDFLYSHGYKVFDDDGHNPFFYCRE